jgi:hypothetical protein
MVGPENIARAVDEIEMRGCGGSGGFANGRFLGIGFGHDVRI